MGTFLLLAPTLIVALTLALAAAVILLTRFVSLAVFGGGCGRRCDLILCRRLSGAGVHYLLVAT